MEMKIKFHSRNSSISVSKPAREMTVCFFLAQLQTNSDAGHHFHLVPDVHVKALLKYTCSSPDIAKLSGTVHNLISYTSFDVAHCTNRWPQVMQYR